MHGAVGLGIVLLAMAILVVNHGEAPIFCLAPGEFASVAALGAMALLVASLIVAEFRGRWGNGLRAMALWSVMLVGLVGFYSYRTELQQGPGRIAGELMPGETTVTPGGEVVVTRRMDGSFVVNGRVVNDRDLRFI